MHPTLLHLGRFILPTFGVLAAAGLMAALALSLRTAALLGLDPDTLWNAGLFTILAALVSSRLLLIAANLNSFLSYPLIILQLPSLTPTGILLTLVATLLYLRLRSFPPLRTLDAWAPCATLIWAFLALGHLAEGSDPGLTTTVPWRILSPTGGAYLHPIALYVAVAAALITLALLRYLTHRPQPGRAAALALAATGVIQFLISFLRHPNSGDVPLGDILDPIQWVSLVMVVAAAVLYIQTLSINTTTASKIGARTNTQTAPQSPEHHAL